VSACKRFPVDPEHDEDEARHIADGVSRLIHVRGVRGMEKVSANFCFTAGIFKKLVKLTKLSERTSN